jgi:hypothetical protein
MFNHVAMVLDAGAEVRSLGRVAFQDPTGQRQKSPRFSALFVFRGRKPCRPDASEVDRLRNRIAELEAENAALRILAEPIR